jgi:hypothetical protein
MRCRIQSDTRTPLSAAPFRRLVCDGRVVLARALVTHTELSRAGRTAVAPGLRRDHPVARRPAPPRPR